MSVDKLILPDDLTALWDHLHNRQSGIGGAECEKIWLHLANILAKKLLDRDTPGIDGNDRIAKARDAADEYLIGILGSERRPDHLFSIGSLVKDMRKYLAKTRNPVQYEMNVILNAALRALEKEGNIKRGSAFAGRPICCETTFILAGSGKSEQCIADRSDYEDRRVREQQRYVVGSRRVGNCEKKRIITPQDARELAIYLLETFGAWTKQGDLLWAMQFHVPEQMRLVSLGAPGGEEEEETAPSRVEGVPDPGAESEVYEQQDVRQALVFAEETAERIWRKICRVSDRVFCLYYLPREIFKRPSVTLQELGVPSTIGDQNQKIRKIFFAERFEVENETGDGGRRGQAVRYVSAKILEILTGRCTEKGYSADLYSDR